MLKCSSTLVSQFPALTLYSVIDTVEEWLNYTYVLYPSIFTRFKIKKDSMIIFKGKY